MMDPGPGATLAARLVPRIDAASPVPLYYQLARALEEAIDSDELPPGSQLDNEIDLARDLGLSRPTVRRALAYLVDRGRLIRRRGTGTWVLPRAVHRSVGLTSLHDDLERAGRVPQTRVLSLTEEPCSAEVGQELGLTAGTTVRHLRRLRSVEGEPLALMDNQLPPGPALLVEDLERTGLYRLLTAGGVTPRVARQSVTARAATSEEAVLLDTAPGAALLELRRLTFDGLGRPIELARHAYVGGRYEFEMTLSGDER